MTSDTDDRTPLDEEEQQPLVIEIPEEDLESYEDIIQRSLEELKAQDRARRKKRASAPGKKKAAAPPAKAPPVEKRAPAPLRIFAPEELAARKRERTAAGKPQTSAAGSSGSPPAPAAEVKVERAAAPATTSADVPVEPARVVGDSATAVLPAEPVGSETAAGAAGEDAAQPAAEQASAAAPAPAPASPRRGFYSLMKKRKKELAELVLDAREEIEQLRARLAELEERGPAIDPEQVVEKEEYLRLASEFEAYRQRTHRQQDEFVRNANRDLILRLLPILDHADLARKNLPDVDERLRGVLEGFTLILDEFRRVLEAQGLAPIEAVGQPFDPRYHEAIMTEVTTRAPENTVMDELRRGYLLHGKLLRASLVSVAKAPQGAAAEPVLEAEAPGEGLSEEHLDIDT
jgi:molecular chaperone GrpE